MLYGYMQWHNGNTDLCTIGKKPQTSFVFCAHSELAQCCVLYVYRIVNRKYKMRYAGGNYGGGVRAERFLFW